MLQVPTSSSVFKTEILKVETPKCFLSSVFFPGNKKEENSSEKPGKKRVNIIQTYI